MDNHTYPRRGKAIWDIVRFVRRPVCRHMGGNAMGREG